MLRLFETGHSQEDRLIADLRRVGATVHARDPDNPKEQISITVLSGHSKGYLDGVAADIPYSTAEWALVECKTHSAKSFAALEKDGVQVSKPQHFAQCQLYMHEHALPEALYLAVSKDTDNLFCEFIPYNERYALALLKKAHDIVYGVDIPARINGSATFYKCKMCSAASVCHAGELPLRTCRTCAFSRPSVPADQEFFDMKPADWICERHNAVLDLDAQKRGCESHRYHPHMVKGEHLAEFSTHERVLYRMPTGAEWTDTGPAGDKVYVPNLVPGE
jgi:hypothetical protein